MLGQAETFTFSELYEVSDANLYSVIGDSPVIIIGPSMRADDGYQYSGWVMSRKDGKPIFGQFRHWFDHRKIKENPEAYSALPTEAHQKAFLDHIDDYVFGRGRDPRGRCREELETKVAKDSAEMNKMVTELWPHTNLLELIQAYGDRLKKMEAAAKKNKDGTCTNRFSKYKPVRPRIEKLVEVGATSKAALSQFDAHIALLNLRNMPTGTMQ